MIPQADYTPCQKCGHTNAEHCPTRGCRHILELGCKTHDPNMLCGCTP